MPRSFVAEARHRVGPKAKRIVPIIDRLAEEHADAKIALRFDNELELLVSVMLSAQTTDVSVNKVTERLFVKYRRPEDYLAVPQEELEQDIFQTGFFRQKAKSLRGAMTMLVEEFEGRVPRQVEELVRLPGVARKTANVVAAELGQPQGVVVDTHVRRLSQRLGLTRQEDPVKIERDLARLVPRSEWGRFPHLLIWHGRRVCLARAPRCADCVVNYLCPASRVERATWDGAPISREWPFGVSVVVFRRRSGECEWLVLHRAHNGPAYDGDWAWTPPSGARLPGESLDDCARRELAEEAGLELACVATDLGREDWAVYVAEAPPDAAVLLDPEHDRFEWLTAEEAAVRCRPAQVGAPIAALAARVGAGGPHPPPPTHPKGEVRG